jgi:hypothetical protein
MFRKNIDLMFAKGRLAVCHKHKFYMTLIPKNISSSAIYFILKSDYPEVAELIDISSPGEIHKYLGLILVKTLHLDSGYKKLVAIRDPYERVLSAFYSKFIFDAAWSGVIINPVKEFLGKNIEDICFRDFLFYLRCHPDEWIDPHFSSQSRFMLFEKYDLLLPVHNSEAVNSALNTLNFEFPTINSTKDRYTASNNFDYTIVDCPGIPVSELWYKSEQKIALPNARLMLTGEIRTTILKRFSDDFYLLEKCSHGVHSGLASMTKEKNSE